MNEEPRPLPGERRAETPPGTHAPRVRAKVAEAPLLAEAQLFERLLAQRIVFLGTEIDDQVANRVNAQLLLLAAQDARRDITIYVNSPGGVVDAGMAIYDMMQFVPNDISTVAMGMAASMGQTLLCAGTAGKRYALRHARVMMHQPHGGIGGTASDIRIQADSDRDRWFTADQAREYGFIDHVIDSTDRVGS